MTTHPTADQGLGLCAVCPVRMTCPAAAHGRTTCPVTGSLPPPAPPEQVPSEAAAMESVPGDPDDGDGQGSITELASRGLEKTISAVLGLGWTDLLAALIERTNGRDADGNAIDWSRLQIARNTLGIGIAVLVPLGGTSAAGWVARWLEASATQYGIAGLFAPAGAVLTVALVLFVGRIVPGPIGDLCAAGWWLASATVRAVRWFLRSRLGWLLTRPTIWALVVGVLIVSWRGLVYLLTGAS